MKKYITFEIPSYALAIMVGWVATVLLAEYRRKKYGYSSKVLIMFVAIVVPCTALGSKILCFITMLPSVLQNFTWAHFFRTMISCGFVYYGGFYGALVGIIIVAKLLNYQTIRLLNFSSPLIAIFHGFGRIGCFFGGCCYGIPWKYGIAMEAMPDIPRFPVQLLESCLEFIIFGVLIHLEKKNIKVNLMMVYMTIYACIRILTEQFRGDNVRGIWFGHFSTSEIIAVFTLIGCAVVAIINRNKMKGRQKIE